MMSNLQHSAIFIFLIFLPMAWSITCYRCGGAAASCKVAGSATVECDDSSMPDAVFACKVYTVNYTSLHTVEKFKSCCFYEDCDKNPCKQFGKNTVCSKMASCQSDKCNSDYATAKASQRPTLPSEAGRVYLKNPVIIIAAVIVFFWSIYG